MYITKFHYYLVAYVKVSTCALHISMYPILAFSPFLFIWDKDSAVKYIFCTPIEFLIVIFFGKLKMIIDAVSQVDFVRVIIIASQTIYFLMAHPVCCVFF